MKKTYIWIVWFVVWFVWTCIAFLIWNVTDKREWKQVYCDRMVWGTYKWIVEKANARYIYLTWLETECLYGCKCTDLNTRTECDDNSEYEFREYMPIDAETEKVWKKTDCYIEGDIDSIVWYMNRES